MQLPRVVIAVVFFVIGAFIAVPALMRSASSSQLSGTPTPTDSAMHTPTAAPTGTARSASPATSASTSPKPTHTPPKPTHNAPVSPPTRVTPPITLTPSRPPTHAAVPPAAPPLLVTIGALRCPARSVPVTIGNTGHRTEDYAIEQDGSATIADRIGPGTKRTVTIKLKEDRATTVAVTWRNRSVESVVRKADCVHKSSPPPKSLPHTGSDDATLYAQIATGVATMITGAIIFWYGGIWPRRHDPMWLRKTDD